MTRRPLIDPRPARPASAATRRDILRAAALAPALALPALGPAPARAQDAPLSPQAPGFFRFTLGDMEVTVLSDGNLTTPASLLAVNADPAEVAAFLEDRFLSPEVNYAHTNHVLISSGDRRVLVDVGSGFKFQPETAGRLLDNMAAAGVDPAEVTDVFLTHAHPDHVWGSLDDFDEPSIPNAAHVMGGAELDWWMAEDRASQVPAEMQAFVAGAQNSLAPLRDLDMLSAIAPGAEVAPGMTAVATPGHTLGHLSLEVESAGRRMLVIGDALNHGHVSFERPDWVFGFDLDGPQAVETRRAILERAVAEELIVVGYHFPFPGVGRVVRMGDSYRFIPALWRWQG